MRRNTKTPDVAPAPPETLVAFTPRHAPRVSSWIRTQADAYWLAPQTPFPITPARVRAWAVPGTEPLLLLSGDAGAPVAYGELNVLERGRAQYWIGHLIVDPEQRRRGLGRVLTQSLLQRAFRLRGALGVSLVVFPENEAAIRCYRGCGFREVGTEWHSFPAYGKRVAMLRMCVRANT